jgi:hypothetical protein
MAQLDPLLEDDLDEYLGAVDIPGVDPSDPDGAPLEAVRAAVDDTMADRILYKVARLADDEAAARSLAAKRRADIDAWEADRCSGIQRERERAERSLELFARDWLRRNPGARRKSISLPSGTLKLAKGRGKIVVDDEHLFTAWCEEHKRFDLLRYEPKPKKAELASEEAIKRHQGVQRNADDGTLVQTYRLMTDVITGVNDEDGELLVETVSIPGVVYTEPVQDKFSIDTHQPQGEQQ